MSDPLWQGREAIVFDGEGVVIDSEPIWDKSQAEFLRRRGIPYDRQRLKPLLAGRSMREGALLLQREFGFPGEVSALAAERVEIVRDVFQRDAEFIPGFLPFFATVRHRFKTCIATVMPYELLTLVIEKLRLRTLFGEHIYSPDVHRLPSKPAPDLFLFAAERLQALPERCIVIEDSPNGIVAAKRARMFAVGLATTFDAEVLKAADLVVTSFAEIPQPD
jgi:HAD superfamily hydrolase (TIGR01509 family)